MNSAISIVYQHLVKELSSIHDEAEATSLATILMEDLLGVSKMTRLTRPNQVLTTDEQNRLNQALAQLLNNVPIQHIVGFAYFCGHPFKVTKDTLIPRPETEELVHLIANENQGKLSILDVGTGTGCIPISLALKMKEVQITSWDISLEALEIAKHNAQQLGAKVTFQQMDALDITSDNKFDVIVSNPPYIPNADKQEMHANVLDHEPGLALFVEDADPLVFYRKIAEFAQTNLNPNGKIYFEIHERFGTETKELLESLGYQKVIVLKDLNGKDRMIKAQR
ncbi:peptide chain release factor N(5)-glutamine methyltransferase [Marinoscillum sp.]|uniref:peptide chain release factor N(5)-glutamine methyltransferase n=1 Tax=Marinoscillum sp. TaxID=2024838 RepID=UPI003BA8774D